MPVILITTWIFWILVVTWLTCYLIKPGLSFVIAGTGAAFFAIIFLYLIGIESFSIWPLVYLIVLCIFFIRSGKNVPYKTQTGRFNNITNRPIGVVESGALNLVDDVLEKATISVNGAPNIAADLQELEFIIKETPKMQTKTRGIQALVRDIVWMARLIPTEIYRLFDVEGGAATVRHRMEMFVLQFLLDRIGQTKPEELDQDKGQFIEDLAEDMREEINLFCVRNRYPYQVVDEITISDTELDEDYYKVLGKKSYVTLEQKALDVEAKKLTKRLQDMGKKLLPGYSSGTQLRAAQNSLKVVPKTESSEKKEFSVDVTTGKMLLAGIEAILKKK
ncbi:MAG: hypothetical protein AAB477_02950 [Patescibacteria group bacterium]